MADATNTRADATTGPRRNPWNVVLGAFCLVALLAAASLLLWSRTAFSDAATARDTASAVGSEQADLVAHDADVDARRHTLSLAAGDVSTAFRAYNSAFTALIFDETKLVHIQNRAVDLDDQGHIGASADLLKNDGDPALADLAQAAIALDQTRTDLETKIQKLRESLDA